VHTRRIDLARPILILFVLNAVDALLTIFWVETGIAGEANHLMDALLGAGVLPFLMLKVGWGLLTCVLLLYGSNFRVARYGVWVGLVAYSFAMGAHLFTGLAAYGLFL
jgi:hypothetical protein